MERTTENTSLNVWFERDRAHVHLLDEATQETVIEWWDEDVHQALTDGFLDPHAFALGKLLYPHRLHHSAVSYANEVGI